MAQPQYTEKAREAIVDGQQLSVQRKLAQFEPEALLAALLDQADGVVPQVLLKLNIDPAQVH
ncbi:MAG: Clp protease N-terminal domain-containing protein, partial [Thermomicrobiales bacterium]